MRTIIIKERHINGNRPGKGGFLATPTRLLALSLLSVWTPAPAAHDYTITVDASLTNMTVAARFDRPVDYISARSRYAARYLHNARNCDTGEKLESRGRTLDLPSAGIRCLSYAVSLQAAERDAAKIVISPTLWMWRPRLRQDDEILATFELPGATRAFVPWQMRDDTGTRYRLVASPQSGMATAIFGKFEERIEHIAGANLRIVLLGKRDDIELDRFLGWIRSTAANVEMIYGRFPNPNASVVLIPVSTWGWGGDQAVTFGRVVRDGGETIELMINPDLPIADYYKAWTPTHEFSHLLLPHLDGEQRWISEGFAQYYQNVLLARAGQYSAQDAWQKIYVGLERGRESAPGMSPNDAAGGSMRNTRMKVYWSGAALALMADVELRRRSAGRESLDTVLSELQRCCLPSARSWSGVELFRKLDERLDQPLFMPLYRQYAEADDFPDARPVLTELGILMQAGQVRLDDTAALANIRDGITRVAATH